MSILMKRSLSLFIKLRYFQRNDIFSQLKGDLLTLLSKYDDNLPEDMCRFYTAQIILGKHSYYL